MDPTAPDVCGTIARGWAGNPLDTAHWRLRRAVESDVVAVPSPGQAADLLIAVEDRINKDLSCIVAINFTGHNAASLVIFPSRASRDDLRITESLHRCLRMLFDDFGIGLVDVENPSEIQGLDEFFRGFGLTDFTPHCNRLDRARWVKWRASRPILWVVAAALIDADNKVLFAQRPGGKSMAGQWEFPGGKIDLGETPEAALLRELREELAVEMTSSCLAPLAFASHDYDHFHLAMPLFAARHWVGRPVPQEGQNLAWVGKDQLFQYVMPPADLPLIAQLCDWL
jgi:8-oxo-dGTP diphosphatase